MSPLWSGCPLDGIGGSGGRVSISSPLKGGWELDVLL